MFYRFPDEYFFPVKSNNDFDFEEIGYRQVIIEDILESEQIINEREVEDDILKKNEEVMVNTNTLSFEEYLMLKEEGKSALAVKGTRSTTSFDENLIFESDVVEEIEDSTNKIRDYLGGVEESTENVEVNEEKSDAYECLLREESLNEEDVILKEADEEYVEATERESELNDLASKEVKTKFEEI